MRKIKDYKILTECSPQGLSMEVALAMACGYTPIGYAQPIKTMRGSEYMQTMVKYEDEGENIEQ